ncbi:alpha/beta hydrolase [Deinococcus budaensis]|uniref:Alpha-beta hydrolase superfamily lysophospholipase n=1 Tax=Deinococcus budaensis TaxID=1665626 RepID=A0A7W8GDG6_9DEIO|nr:alpha/beta fold hydrolase [Deinococcus budaensis]MBB5233567.1 alpha-beta hydrolase superfamily lysophospholipase [Deinococcus budaensis]
MTRRLRFALLSAALELGSAQGLPPAPATEVALDRVPAERVVRPGATAPGTPPDLNASITVRYGPARPRAVLLLMPGFLGGAGSFDRLARQLAALDPGLAVWAVDRRANLLEPQAQLAAADPAELARIVQRGLPVRTPASLGFLQGWGLDLTLRDWRAAVLEARALTPDVFLGGHSLGGVLAGLYAAYDFGGTPGWQDLRGLVLLDGVPGQAAFQPLTRQQYEEGYFNRALPVRAPGLNALARQPYVDSFFFGPTLASRAAAQARLAASDPGAPAPAGGLTRYPATALAAGLTQLEGRYSLLPFLAVRTGQATNARTLPNPLPRLLGAARAGEFILGARDPARPVGWQADPAAPTDPLDFVRRYWTPLADYAEWYFPQRLTLDVNAANLGTRGSPFEQELRVWHGAEVPLPILGLAAEGGLTRPEDYTRYAATTLGALTTHTLPGAAHLDITAARGDTVARWILEWLGRLARP